MVMQIVANFSQKRYIPGIGASISTVRGLNNADPIPTDKNVEMLLSVGAKVARFDLFWADCETTRGVYSWPAKYTDLVTKLKANGITPLIILARGNPLHTDAWDKPPLTAAARTAFASFADAALIKFGVASVYEVTNEANNPEMWGVAPDPVYYGYLLGEVATKMRARNSAVTILASGMAVGGPSGFIDPATFVAQMIPYVDTTKITALAHHAYTGADLYMANDPIMQPEAVRQRLLAIRPAASSLSVWNTEQGFSAVDCAGAARADQLARQAKFAERFVLSSLTTPGLACWYNLVDTGTDPASREHNFGLFDFSYTAKPAAFAFAAAMKLVNDCSSVVVSRDGNLWQAVFAMPSGAPKTVHWSAQGTMASPYGLSEPDGARLVSAL